MQSKKSKRTLCLQDYKEIRIIHISERLYMTCYLVRHGQQIRRPGDPGLTDIGRQQAQEAGEFFLDKNIKTIISSPLRRAIETTQRISSVIGVNYSENPDLIERMNWNNRFGSYEHFFSEWFKATSDRNYTPSSGDSSFQKGKRIQEVIDSLKNATNVVLVTHGGSIGDYLRNIFSDHELKTLFKKTEFGKDYQIMHCSITQLEFDNKPNLRILNSTNHLSIITE